MRSLTSALESLTARWRADAARLRAYGAAAQADVAEKLAEELEQALGPGAVPIAAAESSQAPAAQLAVIGWREKLWACPAETRLGVRELAEALGRPKSFVYRLTSITAARAGKTPLPHRKLDGELVFVAAEIRAWLSAQEEVVVTGPEPRPAAPPATRTLTGRLRWGA